MTNAEKSKARCQQIIIPNIYDIGMLGIFNRWAIRLSGKS